MSTLSSILVALIAFLHLYICWFEMFAWETRGPKVFRTLDKELFPKTTALAANQGLYNAFLAAGLAWSLIITDAVWAEYVALFFLGCVLVAGVFGAVTAERKILYVQTIPALVAIVSVLFF